MIQERNRLAGRQHLGGRDPGHFEAWLQTSLQRLYDESLELPVPALLLDLLPDAKDPASGR